MSYSPGDREILERQRRALPHLAAALILLLAACLSWVVVLASTPPPVNLGAPGLSITATLDSYDAATDTWASADPSAITITDRGDGSYLIGGLPAASGPDRYRVALALAGDPDRALVEMTWGAVPGSQVLWVPRVTVPTLPLRYYEGDSSGTLGLEVRSGLPEAITDPATTVAITLVPEAGGTPLLSSAPGLVATTTKDATTGTWGAILVYTLGSGDFAAGAAGRYLAYWTITWPDLTQRTLPAGSPVVVTILEAPGS